MKSYGYETDDELLQILIKLKDSNIENKTIQEKGDHLGWKSFKMYHTRWKGPNFYYNPFLPYILIPIKNNESKVVKFFKKTIFETITIVDSIIIIHKCVLTWYKRQKKVTLWQDFGNTLKNWHPSMFKHKRKHVMGPTNMYLIVLWIGHACMVGVTSCIIAIY